MVTPVKVNQLIELKLSKAVQFCECVPIRTSAHLAFVMAVLDVDIQSPLRSSFGRCLAWMLCAGTAESGHLLDWGLTQTLWWCKAGARVLSSVMPTLSQ